MENESCSERKSALTGEEMPEEHAPATRLRENAVALARCDKQLVAWRLALSNGRQRGPEP